MSERTTAAAKAIQSETRLERIIAIAELHAWLRAFLRLGELAARPHGLTSRQELQQTPESLARSLHGGGWS